MTRKQRNRSAKVPPKQPEARPGFVWYGFDHDGQVHATTRPHGVPSMNTAEVSTLGERTMRAIHASITAKKIPAIIEQDPNGDPGALRVVIPGCVTITMDWLKSRALRSAFLLIESDGETFAVSDDELRRDFLDRLGPQ